jgi:hypothetical protein
VAGAHRIPINTGSADLGSTPAFNRLINAQHDRPIRRKCGYEQAQQNATSSKVD